MFLPETQPTFGCKQILDLPCLPRCWFRQRHTTKTQDINCAIALGQMIDKRYYKDRHKYYKDTCTDYTKNTSVAHKTCTSPCTTATEKTEIAAESSDQQRDTSTAIRYHNYTLQSLHNYSYTYLHSGNTGPRQYQLGALKIQFLEVSLPSPQALWIGLYMVIELMDQKKAPWEGCICGLNRVKFERVLSRMEG